MEVELGQLTEDFLVSLVGEKRDAGVLVAPNTVHNDNGHEHAGGDHRIDLAEFAGFDSAADDSAEEFLPAGDHFVTAEYRSTPIKTPLVVLAALVLVAMLAAPFASRLRSPVTVFYRVIESRARSLLQA